MRDMECDRCGGSFGLREDHTEIVRRDFRDRPRPATVEHLCGECWHTYVEEFLGGEWRDEPAAERV